MVGHVSQVVVLSNRTCIAILCCWTVKCASGATDHFPGTAIEISGRNSTRPIIGAPGAVE